jgi:hypothetical protein
MKIKNILCKCFVGLLLFTNLALARPPGTAAVEAPVQIKEWITQLDDSDYTRRNAAVRALATQPAAALPLLKAQLKTESGSNRRWWLKVAIQECEENQPKPGEISASPAESNGLQVCEACKSGDGLFDVVERNGVSCWDVPKKGYYLYFSASDAFRQKNRHALEIQVEYLDAGNGDIALDYDSTDPRAPVGGAYKNHSTAIHRTNSGQWRTAKFHLPDARFNGSENGHSDFRFYNGGDDMIIRDVRVWPLYADD